MSDYVLPALEAPAQTAPRQHPLPIGCGTKPASAYSFPISTYLICTNPRSGSWLLSDGLASTLVAGNPREWFNVLEEQVQRSRWRLEAHPELSYLTYFNHVLKSATTVNGICGVKIHYYQLADFARNMGSINRFHGLPLSDFVFRSVPESKVPLAHAPRQGQAGNLLSSSLSDQGMVAAQ